MGLIISFNMSCKLTCVVALAECLAFVSVSAVAGVTVVAMLVALWKQAEREFKLK